MNSAELRDQRAALIAEARKLLDEVQGDETRGDSPEDRQFTAEEEQRYEAIMKDADKLGKRAEAVEREQELRKYEDELRESNRKTMPDMPWTHNRMHSAAQAFRGWLTHKTEKGASQDDVRAANEAGLNLGSDFISFKFNQGRDREFRRRALGLETRGTSAQTTGTTTLGGDLVFEDLTFADRVDIALRANTPMLQVANVISTSTGADLPAPTIDDLANVGEGIIGENSDMSTVEDVTVGQTVLKAYKYISGTVLLSYELLQDALLGGQGQFEGIISELLVQRISAKLNADLTSGNGSGKPDGVAHGATVSVSASASPSTAGFTLDDLIDCKFAITRPYRNGASYMMNDDSISLARKLKDNYGRYLWQPSVQAGEPDQFDGVPIIPNQSCDGTTASGDMPVIYGNFGRYYWVRRVQEIIVQRLVEKYAGSGQIGMVAWCRFDGRIVSAGDAFSVITI